MVQQSPEKFADQVQQSPEKLVGHLSWWKGLDQNEVVRWYVSHNAEGSSWAEGFAEQFCLDLDEEELNKIPHLVEKYMLRVQLHEDFERQLPVLFLDYEENNELALRKAHSLFGLLKEFLRR